MDFHSFSQPFQVPTLPFFPGEAPFALPQPALRRQLCPQLLPGLFQLLDAVFGGAAPDGVNIGLRWAKVFLIFGSNNS